MASTGNPVYPVYLPPPAKRGTGARVDPEIERVQRMARVLDKYLVDPILGLILPGAGDILGSLLGLYTISVALKKKVSPVILARMFLHLGLDAVLGIVPLVGDLVDVGYKANIKNAELLADRANHGGKASARDWVFVVGAALLFVGALGLMVYAVVRLVRFLFID